jgi:cytochrome P450
LPTPSSAAAVPAPTDPVAAVTHPDPYAYYAALALREGLWRDDALALHVASAPSAVRAALAHGALCVRPPAEPVPRHLQGSAAGELFGRLVRMSDGAWHAPLKRLIVDVLAPAARARPLEAIAARVGADCATRSAREPAHWIDAWVRIVPAAAMAEHVGFGADEAGLVARHVAAFTAGFAPPAPGGTDGVRIDTAGTAAAALLDAALRLLNAPPVHSVAARAVEAAAARPDVERHQLAANLVGLVSQTSEATAGLLGNSLLALARDDARDMRDSHAGRDGRDTKRLSRKRKMRDTEALRRHVAAVSRADPSIHNTRRFAAADCEVLGTPLAAGSPVLVVLAAANAGAPGTHHEFGAGPHACPGTEAAVRLVAAALQALLDTGFDLDTLPRRAGYRPLPNARLPVFFPEPSRSAA